MTAPATLSCTQTRHRRTPGLQGLVGAEPVLPAGWLGRRRCGDFGSTDIVAVGRPHVGTQVTTYPGIGSGGNNLYLPMLFKNAFGGSYNSALLYPEHDRLPTLRM